jgi:peptidyl-tRNA hydrolase
LRLKPGGSDGGHNGLKSVQESLETTEYARLRFGIGNDYPKGMQSEFVLVRIFHYDKSNVLLTLAFLTPGPVSPGQNPIDILNS